MHEDEQLVSSCKKLAKLILNNIHYLNYMILLALAIPEYISPAFKRMEICRPHFTLLLNFSFINLREYSML